LIEVASALKDLGVWGWGLSEPEEGLILRENGFEERILLLSGFQKDWLEVMWGYGLTPVISSVEQLYWIRDFLKNLNASWRVHIKIDTGMHRFGIPFEEVERVIEFVKTFPSIEVEGLMTHLAESERPNSRLTRSQLSLFKSVLEKFLKAGIKVPLFHFANTGGIIFLKDKGNLVRPGIGLFGGYPSEKARELVELKPAMSLKSRVVEIKRLRPGDVVGYGATYKAGSFVKIALVPVGYGDGYPRSLSNKGFAWIKGKRVKLVGRVSMKAITFDVTEVEGVTPGDEIILLGGDKAQVPPDELAAKAGTISYELFCNLGRAIPREYVRC